MPSFARTLTVEFRSLLLPPSRVPLRALQSLCRPQCPLNHPTLRAVGRPSQCVAQRRCLTLYKAARAKTTLGQHKVLPFDRYNVATPNASAHEVNLVGGKTGETIIAENTSMQDLYDNHIRPGRLLYLAKDILKKTAENIDRMKVENIPLHNRTFGILEAESIPGNIKDPSKGKGMGALRVTALALSTPLDHFKLAIDRSYQFIKHGSPVEFTIAIKRGKVKKEEKLKSGDPEAWPWMHEHFPHLRPDFILKSMPEGSRYSVDPVSDGRILQFVIIKPSKVNEHPDNYTNRLFKVKESVQTSIARGLQAQLPKIMRMQLLDNGQTEYSPTTSLPVNRVRGSDDPSGKWDSEPTSAGRYLPKSSNSDESWRSVKPWEAKMRKKQSRSIRPRIPHTDKLSKSGGLLRPQQSRDKTAGSPKDLADTTTSRPVQ